MDVILLTAGMVLVLIALICMWCFCKEKYDHIFGEGRFRQFTSGLFWLGLGLFVVIAIGICTSETFVCNRNTGKGIKNSHNLFGQVSDDKEFDLDEVKDIHIQTNTSYAGGLPHHTKSLWIILNSQQRIQVPVPEGSTIEEEQGSLQKYFTGQGEDVHRIEQSTLGYLWFGLGALVYGIFCLVRSLINRREESALSKEDPNQYLPQ